MPPNQQIRTMQGDIEELQRKGALTPSRPPLGPQRSEPPRGLPIEEKLAPPAPRPSVLRAETRPPAPPAPPQRLEQPSPAAGPRPAQEGLSARERLFISPKPPVPPPPLVAPAPPAPTPPRKIELGKPSFEPTIPTPAAKWPKILLTTLIVAALAGGTGGFFYWWLVVKRPPLPPPPPSLEKPAALIPVDESKDYIITLKENDELIKTGGMAKRISTDIYLATYECNEAPGTLRRILIKNTTTEKEEYLNLYPLLNIMKIPNGLGIGLPDSANYTLFSYSEDDGPLPYGVCDRIILVAEINNIEEAKKQLADWEPYIENEMENTMKDLLNISNALPPATPDFQDNIYKNTKIRYKNYPDPHVSFDYAIYEPKNLLIFTTSRESMWAVIDKLTQ